MNEKAKKYLSDILQAIDLIEDFVSDVPTFEDYLTDQNTQSAVERQLGIIGEAEVRKSKNTLQFLHALTLDEIEMKTPNMT